MALFSRRSFSFFRKLPFLSTERRHSLACLNITQFLGAMNDNMFKLILVFMLIDVEGKEKASLILSGVGAIFVIPFLLFSSAAGVLADRFSKQFLLILMKTAEMLIMFLALFAFAYKSVWAGYTLLFLLATHSAAFAPSKYGIIPEIVPKEKISSANGIITGFTYLAVIVGTFLASFLTEITERQFVLTAGFCFLMAVIGFVSAFGIKKTSPQGSKKRVNPLFLYEIYQTLRTAGEYRHLLISIFGSAYFLFLGAFTQLNIIPYAIQTLHLSDIAGGYLFLATALGIAIGSYLAGRASKKQIELGISCFSGVIVGILFILLVAFPSHPIIATIFLVILGIFGGAFIVPFDSYTQVISPQEKRGQLIAAANFLSFCGVLIASLLLYFFTIMELDSSSGFAIIGVLTLLVSIFLTARLSDLALPYFARKLVSLTRMKIEGLEMLDKEPSSILILKEPTLKKCLVLLAAVPNVQLFIPLHTDRKLSLANKLIYSIHFVHATESVETMAQECKPFVRGHLRACLLLKESVKMSAQKQTVWNFFKGDNFSFLRAQVTALPGKEKTLIFSRIEKK